MRHPEGELRALTQALLMGAILLCPPTSGLAADHVVYPAGTFPLDVANVQAATNAGGSVLLKATDVDGIPRAFNFGPATASGRGVNSFGEVEILGETDGGAMTTIVGGNAAIRGQRGRLVVRGIHFDGPRTTAVLIVASRGAEITGNWITIAAETRVARNRIRGVNTEGILAAGNLAPVWVEDNVIAPGPRKYRACLGRRRDRRGHQPAVVRTRRPGRALLHQR